MSNDREYFAAMALQGLLSNSTIRENHNEDVTTIEEEAEIFAYQAVRYADALLGELEKPTESENIPTPSENRQWWTCANCQWVFDITGRVWNGQPVCIECYHLLNAHAHN